MYVVCAVAMALLIVVGKIILLMEYMLFVRLRFGALYLSILLDLLELVL